MKVLVWLTRIGDWMVSSAALILACLLLLYGGYSLWDTEMLYRGAFASKDLMKYKPTLSDDKEGMDLKDLMKINPDICGWLTIDGTHIDYPVVQGKTDMEYVNKDIYGDFSLSGSVFLDSDNAGDFTDSYNLLYGHHMSNGAMFGDVVRFAEQDYFQEHRTGRIFRKNGGSSEIALYACVETDAYDRMIYQPDSRNQENLEELISYIRKKAVQYREMDVTENDRLIGLSTCAEAETNGRVIVFGRLEKEKQVNQT